MDYINLGIVLDYTLLNSLVKIDNLCSFVIFKILLAIDCPLVA